jgi:hypothetical protein
MTPIKFEGVNAVFGANQKEYQPLPAMKLPSDPYGTVITCWEMTPEEREQFLKDGKIYLSLMTFNQPLQPVMLSPDLSVITGTRSLYDKNEEEG